MDGGGNKPKTTFNTATFLSIHGNIHLNSRIAQKGEYYSNKTEKNYPSLNRKAFPTSQSEKTPSLENIQKYIVMKGIFPSLRVLVNKNKGIS